jgi:hypothetical protein
MSSEPEAEIRNRSIMKKRKETVETVETLLKANGMDSTCDKSDYNAMLRARHIEVVQACPRAYNGVYRVDIYRISQRYCRQVLFQSILTSEWLVQSRSSGTVGLPFGSIVSEVVWR